MTTAIGVVITDHLVSGRLTDFRLSGNTLRHPADFDELDALSSIPGGDLVELIPTQIATHAADVSTPVDAIGVAVPGIIGHGVVEDSPNLTQLKGMHMADELTRVLLNRGITAPVHVANDADCIAAGVAVLIQPVRASTDEHRPRRTQSNQFVIVHGHVGHRQRPVIFEKISRHPVVLAGGRHIAHLLAVNMTVKLGPAFAG